MTTDRTTTPTFVRDAWRCGPQTLGDAELLAVMLSGVRKQSSIDVALALVRDSGGLGGVSRSSPRELAQVTGVGAIHATRVAAAFELGRRAVEAEYSRALIGHAADVYQVVAARLAGLAQEVFLVIGIDIRNGLLDVVECARGTVTGVEVHPREVFRPLVRMAAAGGVVVHNHPSGDPTPSPEDVGLTRRLREVGSMIGIPIIDHVVVGDRSFRSIAEWMGTEL